MTIRLSMRSDWVLLRRWFFGDDSGQHKPPRSLALLSVVLEQIRLISQQFCRIEHHTVLGFLPGHFARLKEGARRYTHGLLQSLLQLRFQLLGFRQGLTDTEPISKGR